MGKIDFLRQNAAKPSLRNSVHNSGSAKPLAPRAPEQSKSEIIEAVNSSSIRPVNSPQEMLAAFNKLIDKKAQEADATVDRKITALLSGVVVSWNTKTVLSDSLLRELEQEVAAFGACNGLQVLFRYH